ncbi:hypothetical protein ES702_07407 [subsurface metagenome]
MKLIHRRDISERKFRGIQWNYWAALSVTTTLIGAQKLYAASSTGLAGNIEIGGQLSTVWPHIILGFGFLPHVSIALDSDLLAHGILATFSVSGKEVLKNVLCKALPMDVGLVGGVATTNTTTDLEATKLSGPRFNLGDWLPLVAKGESVDAVLDIPTALGGLSATKVVSFWTLTRRIGYIT